jgi:hypothetical protein
MDRATDHTRRPDPPDLTEVELATYCAAAVRRDGATFADFCRLVDIAAYLRAHQHNQGPPDVGVYTVTRDHS